MEDYVVIDPKYLRAAEVEVLHGDASKAHARLGWKSETTLEQLVAEMVEADLTRFKLHEHL
jgi:GDPmannose 4,6-dehydratase